MTLRTLNARLYAMYLSIVLAIIAGLQLPGRSRDYSNYLTFFERFSASDSALDFGYRFEPGFTVLVYCLALVGLSGQMIYVAIVTMTLGIKFFAIPAKKSLLFVYAVFVAYYLSRYFILFEMTVLRAACAFSIGFLVFVRKTDYRFHLEEFLLLVLSVLFHYSAVVLLFVYFWKKLTVQKILMIGAALFAVTALSAVYVLSIAPQYIFVLSTYLQFNRATLIPVPFLFDMLFLGWLFINWERLDVPLRYCALGITTSIALHFALLEFSIIAGRFRELLSVFLLIAVVRSTMSDSRIIRESAVLFAIVTGLLHLYVLTVYDPLLS